MDAQRRNDLLRGTGRLTWRIDILNSYQPFTAGDHRLQIPRNGSKQRTKVQWARWRRGESPAVYWVCLVVGGREIGGHRVTAIGIS